MYKRGASQEELAKQDKKILEIEKERVEAVRKDNIASQQKMQDGLTAKNERLRQRKLENALEPLTKEAASIQEKLNKLNTEKEEIEKEGKLRPGSTRDQNDRKLMLEGVNEDIKKIRKELDEKLKQVSAIKVEIGPSAPASPQSTDSKAYARTQRQGGTGSSAATPPPASASTTPNASQLSSVLQFTSPSGTESNFKGMNQGLQDKLLAAATDYNAVTGNKIQVNSAFRTPEDQQRLWDQSVKLGTPGRGPEGFVVAKPGTSPHESGRAVDIQNWTDPKAVAAMNKQGLKQTVPGDYVHFQQARDGGLFNGPSGGYPVELHGREAIVPLPDPSSKISVETSASKTPLNSVLANDNGSSTSSAMSSRILEDLYNLMESKLDELINASRDGNDISDKLLKYSRV